MHTRSTKQACGRSAPPRLEQTYEQCTCAWTGWFFTYNLQFDGLAVQLDRSDLEINANCADVRFRVCVVRCTKESNKHTCMACMTQRTRPNRCNSSVDSVHIAGWCVDVPNRSSKQDFPTPLSPMSSSLNKKSLQESNGNGVWHAPSMPREDGTLEPHDGWMRWAISAVLATLANICNPDASTHKSRPSMAGVGTIFALASRKSPRVGACWCGCAHLLVRHRGVRGVEGGLQN